MADLTVTAKNVKPLIPSQVVKGTTGGTMTVGDLVVDNGSEVWVKADADAAATAVGLVGIVVAGGARRSDGSILSGEKIDVVVFGRVTGFTGVNGGQNYYVSANAGKVAETAGTVTRFVANGEDTTTLFILGVGVATSA